jgi:hypothetical protein
MYEQITSKKRIHLTFKTFPFRVRCRNCCLFSTLYNEVQSVYTYRYYSIHYTRTSLKAHLRLFSSKAALIPFCDETSVVCTASLLSFGKPELHFTSVCSFWTEMCPCGNICKSSLIYIYRTPEHKWRSEGWSINLSRTTNICPEILSFNTQWQLYTPTYFKLWIILQFLFTGFVWFSV